MDPELVASWHDRREYAFFAGRFGMDAGRVVSSWPKGNVKHWEKLAVDALKSKFTGGDPKFDMAVSRLTALLSHLSKAMIKRPRRHSFNGDWLQETEAEHGNRSFYAILSQTNPRQQPFVVTSDELTSGTITDEKNAQHWEVPPAPSPSRNADELAQAVAPILRCCQRAVFVDPHFDPDPYRPRFLNTLREMLAILWGQNRGLDVLQAELHISADKKGESEILRKCRAHLPGIIPHGRKISVVIWKSRAGGEKLHNRYLLTDIGSVGFGVGLDEADEAKKVGHNESDDLFRLSSAQHVKRWGQYVSAPVFDQACKTIELPE
ncbi:MAG: hypothetical protein HQL86_05100 [Magnetococcales bacterium]|nr:hypothetical protein [Magnetococcales bacterium]